MRYSDSVSAILQNAIPLVFILFTYLVEAIAHGVTSGDKGYIQESTGVLPIPFIYLGAKHMMMGYDHLLFLLGVIFYLYRRKDVTTYVTLFAADLWIVSWFRSCDQNTRVRAFTRWVVFQSHLLQYRR
jgi:HupE / UreJ protein